LWQWGRRFGKVSRLLDAPLLMVAIELPWQLSSTETNLPRRREVTPSGG
jgi:hypothetical protein